MLAGWNLRTIKHGAEMIYYNDLKEIVRKHELWVNGEEGGECADLRDGKLQDADLFDLDLRGAKFQNADLFGADLFGADLRGANLQNTNLQHTCLLHAKLPLGYAYYYFSPWYVTITPDRVFIGCQVHTLDRWKNFSDAEIAEMDAHALEWWREHKNKIMELAIEAKEEQDSQEER